MHPARRHQLAQKRHQAFLQLCLVLRPLVPMLRLSSTEDDKHRNDAPILVLVPPHTLSKHCFVDTTTGTRIYLRSWAPTIMTISGNMLLVCSSLSGISTSNRPILHIL